MGNTRSGEDPSSGSEDGVSIDDLNAAIRYLVQLAAELGTATDAPSATPAATPNTESVLKKVVAELLKHRARRHQLARQVKLAGLLPDIEPLIAPWLKGSRREIDQIAATLVHGLHEGDPLIRWDITHEKVIGALNKLNKSSSGKDPRRETAQFLGLLCGASSNTMLNSYRALLHGQVGEGAVKTQSQAIAFRDDMPAHLPEEFWPSNLRWLDCWQLGVQSSRIQAAMQIVVGVHNDVVLASVKKKAPPR